MKKTFETDAQLQAEISLLFSQYAACIDNDRLEEWPDFFVEKCVYKIQSRENYDRGMPISAMECDSKGMLVDRIVSLREANIFAEHMYRHIISIPMILSYADGEITTETNYLVLSTLQSGISHVFSVGRYQDRLVRIDGRLKFGERVVIFDTNSIRTQIVTPI